MALFYHSACVMMGMSPLSPLQKQQKRKNSHCFFSYFFVAWCPCCLHPCIYRDSKEKNSVWKKDTTASKWEIRNISIFITATWKTLDCLHPVQQVTQRQLAWGQISIVRCPDPEKNRETKTKWAGHWVKVTIAHLQYWPGGVAEENDCAKVESETAHLRTLLACTNTNLGFPQSKSQRLEFCSCAN